MPLSRSQVSVLQFHEVFQRIALALRIMDTTQKESLRKRVSKLKPRAKITINKRVF